MRRVYIAVPYREECGHIVFRYKYMNKKGSKNLEEVARNDTHILYLADKMKERDIESDETYIAVEGDDCHSTCIINRTTGDLSTSPCRRIFPNNVVNYPKSYVISATLGCDITVEIHLNIPEEV